MTEKKFEVGQFLKAKDEINPEKLLIVFIDEENKFYLCVSKLGHVSSRWVSFDYAQEWKDEPCKVKKMFAPALVLALKSVFLPLKIYMTTASFYSSEEDARKDWKDEFIQWPAYEANWPEIEMKK